jgi:methionyl-tRNA formyltransferase
MGSSRFGIPALERLIAAGQDIVAIVSTPAKAQGRGRKIEDSPVSQYAHQISIKPVIKPEDLKDGRFFESLRDLDPQLFVVVAFRMLPESIFSLPSFGTVNIHASLLPRWRGPAPIQRAIEAGDKETGVTIFRIDSGIDAGGIILQKKAEIFENECTPSLYDRLSILGAEAILEAIESLRLQTFSPIKQDSTLATKAPKLTKAEARIDWRMPASAIFNRIRAFKPFPGTHTMLEGRRIGIEWALPLDEEITALEPGTIARVDSESFIVQCGKGRLRILEVKPESKATMSVSAFLHGHQLIKGARFQ